MSLNSETSPVEHKRLLSSDQVSHSHSVDRKGKVLETEIVDSRCLENVSLKKNGSCTEVISSALEKNMVQAKATTVKTRQTQSGPLMPGIVLNHSHSERSRISERFVIVHFSFVLKSAFSLMKSSMDE